MSWAENMYSAKIDNVHAMKWDSQNSAQMNRQMCTHTHAGYKHVARARAYTNARAIGGAGRGRRGCVLGSRAEYRKSEADGIMDAT